MTRQGWIPPRRRGPARRRGLSLRLAWFGALDRECRAQRGSESVNSTRPNRHAALLGAATLAAALAGVFADAAHAQGKLDARYTVTLGGLPVGRGSWVIDIADDHFTATASGSTAGLIQVFTSGQGQSAARGTVAGEKLIPSTYVSSVATDRKHDEVRMVISSGTVKEYVAEPPNVPSPDRVPVTEAHRRGVADPMTASLMRVPGSGSTFGPQACPRNVAVFDGRMRYDLQLAFKRLESVRAERGYQGTVVVCSVVFAPIAGHIPNRAAIKYLAARRDIEAWLAPIAGTRVMVPYRVSIPTPIGVGVLQATQFVSMPQPSRTNAKTQ
jgi:Protein of unknown function (DUF3108)